MFESQADLPLPAVKLALGQPHYLDYCALPPVDAHRKLGEQVRAQVHHILQKKFRELTPEALAQKLRLVRHCQDAIRRKLDGPGPEALRAALAEYRACLAAWGEGAQLAAFAADNPRDLRVDGQLPSADDLAYLLQDDDTGCQTGLWRSADGTVCLSHTEEDHDPMGVRFDRLRFMAFSVTDHGRSTQLVGFIYPDLLPGSAFAWRSDNYVQAVDSLGLKPREAASGILANVATWVALRLGRHTDLEETLAYLGPFSDGYALNVAYADGWAASGRKVEFVGTGAHSYRLDEAPGSFLYQVNKFTDPGAALAQRYEALSPKKRQRLDQRLARAEGWLRALSPEADAPAALFQFLCSQDGGEYGCANADVKAYLIAQCGRNHFQVSVGTGPALAGDRPETYRYAV